MHKLWVVGSGLSVCILGSAGCASSTTEAEEPVASHVTLEGVYVATNDAPTFVTAIAFHADHYRFVPAGCVESACEETGTFTIADGGRRLDLTSEAGTRREVPMSVTDLSTQSLRPADAPVGAPERLVEPTEKLITENVRLLGDRIALFKDEAVPIPDSVVRDVRACIDDLDYNRLPVKYEAAGDTYTHRSGSTGWQLAGYIATAGGAVINAVGDLKDWVSSMTWGSNQGVTLLADLEQRMITQFNNAESSGQPFQNYQKVCMAQCISSRIIKYAADALSKFGGTTTAVSRGVGVCTEFSSIAMRMIGSTAGSTVSSWRGVSPGHSFVQVQFDGNTYSIEPQLDPQSNGECTFYR